jgi:exonuclease VII large subunit
MVNLKKGYAIIHDPERSIFDGDGGKLIKRAAELKKNKVIDIEFIDGKKKAKIN